MSTDSEAGLDVAAAAGGAATSASTLDQGSDAGLGAGSGSDSGSASGLGSGSGSVVGPRSAPDSAPDSVPFPDAASDATPDFVSFSDSDSASASDQGDGGLVGLGLLEDDDTRDATVRLDVRTLLPLLVAAVAGALVYVLVLGACLETLAGQDARTNPGWDWYLVVGAAFSVAAAGVTIRLALRAPLGYRLPLLAAASWLGMVWPLAIAVCLTYVAARVLRASAAALRLGVLAAAAVLLAGGTVWGLHAYSGELHRVPLSTSALIGTWRTDSGASVTLRADGSYSATVPAAFLADGDGTAYPPSPGTWDVQDDGAGHTVVSFTPDAAPERRGVLTAYSVASRRLLCVEDNPGDVCDTAFARAK